MSLLAELEPESARRAELLPLRPTGPARTPHQPAAPTAVVLEPVVPVEDAGELTDLLGQLIEEASDPVDVERALEAVGRFARERPRTGGDVLARRAAALLGERYPGPWTGEDVRADLAALTLVWLTGADPGRGPRGRLTGREMRANRFVSNVEPDWTLATLVSLRIHEIARATHAGGATTLSLPTHRDGSIAAGAMQARIRLLPRASRPWPLDTSVAALRLEPESRSLLDLPGAHRTARAMAAHLKVLDGYRPRWEPVIGPSLGIYRAVNEQAGTWRDAPGAKGATDDAVAAVLDRRDPLRPLALEANDGEYGSRFEQVSGLWPLLLPHHPELLAAQAHARLNRALTPDAAARPARASGRPPVRRSGAAGRDAGGTSRHSARGVRPSAPWQVRHRSGCRLQAGPDRVNRSLHPSVSFG